jgi:hypothetical protein
MKYSNPIAEFIGEIKTANSVSTPKINGSTGTESILIDDDGYLRFSKGVVHSRGVNVGNTSSNFYNRWIKFAETEVVGDSLDTLSSIFVVSLVGASSGNNRSIDGNFIIAVKHTGYSISPYYRTAGTKLYVEAITSTDLAYTANTTWDPADSIFMTFSDSALTGTIQLWFRSPVKDQSLFVSQVVGTGLTDGYVTDPAFIISTGQLWEQGNSSASTGPWPEPDGLGQKIYGSWVSKKLDDLQVTGTATIENSFTPASASADGTTGSICWDSDYVYVCTATDTWKRTAIATW